MTSLGTVLCAMTTVYSQDQRNTVYPQTLPGIFELGIYFGSSLPLAAYSGKATQAAAGTSARFDVDYYSFVNNKLGFSLEFVYQHHDLKALENDPSIVYNFKNGYTTFSKEGAYKNYALLIGPVCKVYSSKKWEVNAHARVGIVGQSAPRYHQSVHAYNSFTGQYEKVGNPYFSYNYYDLDNAGLPIAFMPNLGLRLNYKLTTSLLLGFRADYCVIPAESNRIGVQSSGLDQERLQQEGITFANEKSNNFATFIQETKVDLTKSQTMDLSIGLHYSF